MRKETSKSIIPFPYQRDCVEIIKKASMYRGRILLSIAAGFGRSVIIVQALKELLETKKVKRALIVAPRNVLLDMFSRFLFEHSLKNARLISDSKRRSQTHWEKEFEDTPIFLSSVNTLRKEMAQLASNFFDIVFLDECHNLSESDWEIVGKLESTIVGLTSNHPSLIKSKLLDFFGLKKPTYSYGISSVRLKELADIVLGANYSSADLSDKGTWKFIRPRDIRNNRILKVKTFASERLAKRNSKSVLVAGDIILQNIFNFRRMAMVKEKDLPAIASRNFFVIRSTTISSEFLFDCLQSKTVGIAFQKQLEDLAHGAPIRHIALKDVMDISVPLPFSDEHLTRFAAIRQYGQLRDLEKARNEIMHLKRAFQQYSKKGD
jgi:hypothetical protein